MAETKDEIAAERDALRAENENRRGQLVAASATTGGRVQAPKPFLTEGERQELITFGFTTWSETQIMSQPDSSAAFASGT